MPHWLPEFRYIFTGRHDGPDLNSYITNVSGGPKQGQRKADRQTTRFDGFCAFCCQMVTVMAHRHHWYQLSRISEILQHVIHKDTYAVEHVRQKHHHYFRHRALHWQEQLLRLGTTSAARSGLGLGA